MEVNEIDDKKGKEFFKMCEKYVGSQFSCVKCKNEVGHNADFHRKTNELLRLCHEAVSYKQIAPTVNVGLGPLAQNPSPQKQAWINYINDDVLQIIFPHLLNLDPRKIFLISEYTHIKEYTSQFKQDQLQHRISGLDVERLGWFKGCKDNKEQENQIRDTVSSVQVSFGNGHVYIFNLKVYIQIQRQQGRTESLPRLLQDYLRSNAIIKVGVAIFKDIEYLRNQFKQACWHIVDLRYLYLGQTVLPWTDKKNGLKDASEIIVGQHMKKFDAETWGRFVRQPKWNASVINYSALDALVALAITFVCGALVSPSNIVNYDTLEKFIYEQKLLPYVDVKFDEANLTRIINAPDFREIHISLTKEEQTQLREEHRTVFYWGYAGLRYPHDQYRTF